MGEGTRSLLGRDKQSARSGREQRAIVLDMCYAHLVRRGFGVLELASLRLEESEDIGYQVAEELNLPR